MTLEPELGIPYLRREGYLDLRKRLDAMLETAYAVHEGEEFWDFNDVDRQIASALTHAYAEDPVAISRKVNDEQAAQLPTTAVLLAKSILDEYGRTVIASAVHIRNLIVNKLLIESDNKDPRIRLRALEMLGKISDVGLFVEKHEHKVTHDTTDALREQLREKLTKLIQHEDEDIEEGVFEVVPEFTAETPASPFVEQDPVQ